MGPHSSDNQAFVAMKKCLSPQVSKQPDGLGLGTCSFFVEFFLLGSSESIPRPGVLFQQKVIAKVIAKKNTLMIKKGKEKGTWNKRAIKK